MAQKKEDKTAEMQQKLEYSKPRHEHNHRNENEK
jgi:hypothetical protein